MGFHLYDQLANVNNELPHKKKMMTCHSFNEEKGGKLVSFRVKPLEHSFEHLEIDPTNSSF